MSFTSVLLRERTFDKLELGFGGDTLNLGELHEIVQALAVESQGEARVGAGFG